MKLHTTYRQSSAEAKALPYARSKRFSTAGFYDNPYVRVECLDDFECVTGIVSAPDLYLYNSLHNYLICSVRIDLRGFDALITTCPLNISQEICQPSYKQFMI